METAWYWRQGGHTERWNVCELRQRALYSAGPNTHMNTCPGPSGGSRNSPAYHLSHDPLGDFVFLTPRTLRSAVRSPILQREVLLPGSGREQQERGTPYHSRSNWSWPAEGSMAALTQGAGRNEYLRAPLALLPPCTVNRHVHKHHAWEANGYQGSRFSEWTSRSHLQVSHPSLPMWQLRVGESTTESGEGRESAPVSALRPWATAAECTLPAECNFHLLDFASKKKGTQEPICAAQEGMVPGHAEARLTPLREQQPPGQPPASSCCTSRASPRMLLARQWAQCGYWSQVSLPPEDTRLPQQVTRAQGLPLMSARLRLRPFQNCTLWAWPSSLNSSFLYLSQVLPLNSGIIMSAYPLPSWWILLFLEDLN